MHIEEARWLSEQLASHKTDVSPLLNLGSSTYDYRNTQQPFIEELIFSPLIEHTISVIHSDIKKDDGVDLVGDINESLFREKVLGLSINSVLCSNLLEHVDNPHKMATSILSVIPVNGLVFVTVPYKYPKHLDPIDTMFRPSPRELELLFHGTEVVASKVLSVGTVGASLVKKPGELLKMLVRSCIPFYRFSGWVTTVNKLGWFFKNRKIACVVLRKKA
jgi:hypothetical protein